LSRNFGKPSGLVQSPLFPPSLINSLIKKINSWLYRNKVSL